MKKRDFLKKAGVGAAAVAATAVNAPYVKAQSKTPIKWRLQPIAVFTRMRYKLNNFYRVCR